MRRWRTRRVDETRRRRVGSTRSFSTLTGYFLLAAAVAVGLVPRARTATLRNIGWFLVIDSPLAHCHDIAVSVGSYGAGALEAADLVRDGLAQRVAVVGEPLDAADREFIRRGVTLASATDGVLYQLRALGIEHVQRIALSAEGSESEGQVLAAWVSEQRLDCLTVVTTRDHTRRVSRILRRSLPETRVTVRASRYSAFDPESWWQTRGGLRTGLLELQKLAVDIIRHPLG